MKASNDMRQEELDLLLFEYLEGELAAEETKALEERLAKEPALQEELESWKASYVEQDFYDTAGLEKRISSANRIPGRFPFTISLNIVVPALVAVLLSFMLLTDERKEPTKVAAERNTPAARMEVSTEETEGSEEPAPVVADNAKAEKVTKPRTEANQDKVEKEDVYRPQQEEEISNPALPGIERLPAKWAERSSEILSDITVKRVKVTKKERVFNISRRQLRMIERRKEKASQERRAREFMKGNVPYVVPLNTQNF